MGQFVKRLFGAKSNSEKAAQIASAQAAQANQVSQQAAENQQLQAQGQDQARLDRSLTAARKVNRGRQLLMDTGGGKSTVG